VTVLVDDMIAEVRLRSALRNNPLYSNDQIASFLTDAYADMRDRVNARNAFWFRGVAPFTLDGGNDSFTLDLSTIPDFQEAQYLNWISGGVRYDVPLLSTVQDRNRYQTGGPWGGARRHFIDGDQLEVLPPSNAQGTYELVYTPQFSALSPTQTRSFAIDAAAQTLADPPDSGFNFANADFSDEDIGGTMNVQFDAPNDGLNGSYVISGIHSGSTTWCFVVGGVTPFAVTGTPTGTVALTFQPAGTVDRIPQSMSPWALYMVLHASIAIRTGRKQDTSTLDRQLDVQLKRLVTATKQRSQGVTQAPIRRLGVGLNYSGWGRSS
jgi:hypothetical protein